MKNKILWFDDQPQKITYYINKLKQNGYRVQIAKTYTEAEKALGEEDEFQLIILDSLIPAVGIKEQQVYPGTGIKGGLTFFRVMKQKQLLDPSKVVVFTVSYEPNIYREFVADGLPEEHYLIKEDYTTGMDFYYKVKELIETFG